MFCSLPLGERLNTLSRARMIWGREINEQYSRFWISPLDAGTVPDTVA
jgi:hypothetical protein